jgi:hypothetical protein
MFQRALALVFIINLDFIDDNCT